MGRGLYNRPVIILLSVILGVASAIVIMLFLAVHPGKKSEGAVHGENVRLIAAAEAERIRKAELG